MLRDTNERTTATESGIFPAYRANDAARYDDDEVLLVGLLANLPCAWRAFQRRYDRLVHRCITKVTRRFTSVLSADDVRDIYGAFYVSLLANDRHKLRSFDPERGNRFSSWIGMLAINAAYDYLRTVRREPPKEELAEATELVVVEGDAFDAMADRERLQMTAQALDGFSAKDRAFAALYFSEGLEPSEIATRMNISVKTVYSKKHKIQTRLEGVLGRKCAA